MIKRLYAKLAQLQIVGVVRAERASKVDAAKLRAQRSHFMYVVMGELLKKARGDEGIKSLINRAVSWIGNPKEKEKAVKQLSLLQAELGKARKAQGTSTKAAGVKAIGYPPAATGGTN